MKISPNKLSLIFAVIFTSAFWVFLLLYRLNTTEKASVGVVSELFSTIKRQKDGWENSNKANSLLSTSLAGNCNPSESCYMQIYTEVTKLQTLSDKEKQEIRALWKSNLDKSEFNVFFNNLSAENKTFFLKQIQETLIDSSAQKVQKGNLL